MYNAFTNPEYMTFSEVQKILNQNSRLGPPPNHRPPPPPVTPPIICHKIPKVPLYQNVNPNDQNESNLVISEISSNSSSSNATMIVRRSPPSSSVFESDDSLASMIVKDDPISPPRPILKNRPRIINRINSTHTPVLKKRIGSLSPIMTSSRADLNSVNKKHDLFSVFCEIEEELNVIEPTIIPSPPPPIAKSFNNVNYYYVPNSLNSSSDNIVSDNSETESSLCSLVLQPPSPFKSPKQSCLKIEKPGCTKKVSFLINNSVSSRSSTSSTSSTSSCSSISSTSSSDIILQGTVKELDLIQEKIFSKIFSNQDYFVSDLINKIESASSSSIPSSCASSTSSQSSGYKSMTNTSKILNQSSTELKEFIDTNKERLERLKIRRNQLL